MTWVLIIALYSKAITTQEFTMWCWTEYESRSGGCGLAGVAT